MLKLANYSLWALTGLAGVGWVLALVAELALAFGYPALAIWLSEAASHPAGTVTLVVLFAGFALVASRLSPRLVRRYHIEDWVRGTPRIVFVALALTLLFLAMRIGWLAATGTPEPMTHALLIGFFALSFAVLISGARIGLGTPTCENGHPIAFDMHRCSLCDAPAKNVVH